MKEAPVCTGASDSIDVKLLLLRLFLGLLRLLRLLRHDDLSV